MNMFAAAWTLAMYQIWNKKRRWSTIGLFLFPVVVVICVSIFGNMPPDEFYRGFVTIALGSMLLPFVAVFWGSAVLTDEIEGKTLVYLWTRPVHRGLLITLKLLSSWVWLALLSLVAIGVAFLYGYSKQPGGLADNWIALIWDWRAITLGAFAYAALGFLLSVLVKKPLTQGLMFAYAWEIVPQFGPGFIRRLSIRQQVLSLVTHKEAESTGLAKTLIAKSDITEGEALLTLCGFIVVCLAVTIYLATRLEYLSDDPARNQ